MYRGLMIFFLLFMLLSVTGCETFKGVGRDMQKAGGWVEDTASK